MRFGIRGQALLLAIIPALSLLALLAVSTVLVKQTSRVTSATQRLADALEYADKMMQDLSAATRSAAFYGTGTHPNELAAYRSARVSFRRETVQFREIVTRTPLLQKAAVQYAGELARGMALVDTYVAAYQTGGKAAARRVADSATARNYGPEMQQVRVAFDQAAQPRTLRRLSASRDSLQQVQFWLIVCAIAGLVLSLLASILFAMRIVRRLEVLGDNARRLAAGQPTLAVTGGDEISKLDVIYREMAQQIQASSHSIGVLQRALLPEMPHVPGLRIDSAYATPADSSNIGGDWFDVFVLSDREVGLSIGDVTGHGLRAATIMGFVRQAMRIVARSEHDPATVMQRVNEVLCYDERGIILTAFFAILDRATGDLRYSVAGHAPPIVATSSGDVSTLPGEGIMLGIEAETRFTTHDRRLAAGESLILYTDGIVEVERDYLKGTADLERAIRDEFRSPSANRAEGIQQRIFRDTPPRDDAALLVVTLPVVAPLRVALGGPLRTWDFDARSREAARKVKRELLSALRGLGADAPDFNITEIVFGELLSNVVKHTPGPARVTLALKDRHVVIEVHDRDRTYASSADLRRSAAPPPADAESGRGLFLICALCTHVTIAATADGKCTTVVLPRPKEDGDGAGIPSAEPVRAAP